MFSRQKPPTAKKRNHDLSQFGLMEIPDDFDPTGGLGDDENDSDLEAELAALSSGGGAKAKPKAKPKPTLVPAADLDKMIADSLKDVPSDDDDDDDVDENELMGELKNIAGDDADELVEEEDSTPQAVETFLPTTTINTAGIIQQRIELYKQAEAQAKDAGETAKVRRLGRGLKTLQELLKKAATGQAINVDDIPPEVSIKVAKPATEQNTTTEPATPPSVPARAAPPPPSPIRAAPPTPKTEEVEAAAKPQNPLLDTMLARQREYKEAALQAKRSGEMSNALQFLKVVKQFDIVMDMVKNGQEVDMSDMPPAPAEFAAFMAKMQQGASSDTPAQAPPAAAPPTAVAAAKPATPTSILEALQQRLDKYKSVETAAKEENNASKARRYNRIVKQYEDAIKQHKAGKPVAYDELPVPPGFEPLTSSIAAGSTETSTPSTETTPVSSPQAVTRPQRVSPPADLTTRTSGNLQRNNLAEQQMKILVERQSEFKKAAIEAKKAGEMQQAKEYLKIFKGFDALLNAASSGLPVDLTTLPVPPSQRDNLEASFAIVNAEDGEVANDDISDIGVRLEEQLAKQLMMCKNTRDHHKAMGDIAGMNRFENLALAVQKDLDLLRYSKRQNLPLPKFHYEKRSFNIVHCNTDLRDDELEIMIVRGINYVVPNPKDVDTYVKIEFPLLNEEFFRAKSNLIKDTNSPDYNQRFSVEIQRNNRQFQRFFKRHGVKFEVYSRGGFLRSDVLIGTVNVKLQPLETKCDIHDTFDLMEGRRAVGGKLEVKLRLRNPILAKQMEHIDEKWLVLDS